MKWRNALVLTLTTLSLYADDAQIPTSSFLIDGISAVLFGSGGTQVITKSDVVKPSLSGASRTLDELIFERLVFLDAQKYKIMSDEDAVDKYLAAVQKENNLTLDQLKEVFTSAGYSYEEGREQFRMLQTVNSMLDFKIRSQVIVPKKSVEEYFNTHPEIREATYYVEYGVIPYDYDNKEAQKKALDYMAKTGKEMRGITWQDPFWISPSEVADDKAFIFRLKEGQISRHKDRGDGYELYRMITKKEPTLEDKYKEIADILRRPLFDELMDRYKKNLFDTASIVYF